MAAIGLGWVDGAWVEAGWVANPGAWASVGVPSVAVAGTVVSATEADVVAGNKTLRLTLTDDTFVAAGATFNAQRQALIDGLDSAQGEEAGWNAEVRDKEVVTAVVRTSDTVVTVTLTSSPDYNITADETITVTIPAAALVTSVGDLTGAPTFDVTFVADVSDQRGGHSMTEAQMRRLERQQIRRLMQIKRDDDEVLVILSQMMH